MNESKLKSKVNGISVKKYWTLPKLKVIPDEKKAGPIISGKSSFNPSEITTTGGLADAPS
ncbi:hypothetical protein IBE48_09445 [Francisella philomiragia]|uniref:Uncharacterized protein n=1 Tax=Francisella philomiragia TaxID=28110 RepID=A0AAW3D9X3_9GAMM|nr:hypothetical protein [Francisella philomiragia]KFJ42546.1 hypothetical protein DR78_425 [Francisella philomiragia]MBK2255675.1 hypothetical protein [Francisella philomiragia]MBK2273986.1 hypothetical protein [Francisella philomiragia]MBK2277827.1 hypothetical protein [Francisella philomiragia]MBK2281773.1 hypothetical protein [Francisella philomiragia]